MRDWPFLLVLVIISAQLGLIYMALNLIRQSIDTIAFHSVPVRHQTHLAKGRTNDWPSQVTERPPPPAPVVWPEPVRDQRHREIIEKGIR